MNKHGGKRKNAGRKPSPKAAKICSLNLSEKAKNGLKVLGNGNISKGACKIGEIIHAEMSIDKFFVRSTLFEKSRVLLELIQENPGLAASEETQKRLIDILADFESMRIERDYKEAALDGVIELKGNTFIV